MRGKSQRLNFAWAILAISAISSLAALAIAQPALLPSVARDHVLIKFKPEISPSLSGKSAAEGLQNLASRLSLPHGAELKEPAINQILRGRTPGRGTNSAPLSLERFLYLVLPPGLSVEECIARLQHHPDVEYVEPDGVGTGGALIPNDPDFSAQWHHQNADHPSACINTPEAWDITQGSSNVVVAVLDSGLSGGQEFSGRIVPGYNFAYTNFNTAVDEGHGTAASGTI